MNSVTVLQLHGMKSGVCPGFLDKVQANCSAQTIFLKWKKKLSLQSWSSPRLIAQTHSDIISKDLNSIPALRSWELSGACDFQQVITLTSQCTPSWWSVLCQGTLKSSRMRKSGSERSQSILFPAHATIYHVRLIEHLTCSLYTSSWSSNHTVRQELSGTMLSFT